LCLVSIALAQSLIPFVVAALLFGAAKGAVDVGINAQAVVVEKCYGRPIMSSFQALWSVGGLAGGFLTSAALGLGSAPVTNVLCAGCLILLLDLVFYSHLLRDASSWKREGGKLFRLPSKTLFYVAALTFIALFSEGVLQDWAAVYMVQVVAVPVAVAAVGYAGYATAMAVGRFVGDRVVALYDALKRCADRCWLNDRPLGTEPQLRHCRLYRSRTGHFQPSANPLRRGRQGSGLGAWTRHRRRYHVGLFWFSDRTGDDWTDVEVFWSSNSP
jgi:hypothetical protein